MNADTEAALNTNEAMLRLGNDVRTTPLAVFVQNPNIPSIWDANHVSGIRASTEKDVAALLTSADEAFAYCSHRRFHVDPATPPEFVARLELDGYEREDTLVMLLDGPLAGIPAVADIRPVTDAAGWESMWELMLLDWQEHQAKQGRDTSEAVGREMWAARKLKQPPIQYWLAYVDGKPVAYFASWDGTGGFGQVEDLFTHPGYRLKGIARALIHHCVAESRASGAERVVIAADPADTPKKLYASLGFRPVALVSRYLKRLD